VYHVRTKHIEIDYHYIHDKVKKYIFSKKRRKKSTGHLGWPSHPLGSKGVAETTLSGFKGWFDHPFGAKGGGRNHP
jgi:hypothetical protein